VSAVTVAKNSKKEYESDAAYRERLNSVSFTSLIWLLQHLKVIDSNLSWRLQTIIAERHATYQLNLLSL
jgi:hypothetical protein